MPRNWQCGSFVITLLLNFRDHMKRNRKIAIIIPCFILMILLFIPDKAYAFSFGGILTDIIVTPLREGATYLLQQSFIGVGKVISQPTNLNSLAYLQNSIDYAKYIALSLLCISFVNQLIKMMIEEGRGNGSKPIDMLVTQAIKAVCLIYLSQWILEDFLIAVNNALIPVVTSMDTEIFASISESTAAQKADDITRTLLAVNESIGVLVMLLLLVVVLGIGFLVLVLLAGYRIAQLGFLMVIGPLLAVSTVDKGEAYNTWIRESVAVVFTQLFQVWMLGFLMALLMRGTFWDFLSALGVLALMIAGPTVLKTYLHSSGIGGAAVGTGRTVAYRYMLKGAMKR